MSHRFPCSSVWRGKQLQIPANSKICGFDLPSAVASSIYLFSLGVSSRQDTWEAAKTFPLSRGEHRSHRGALANVPL